MIDMHCHLLPGVDDGVTDMNEAIYLVEQAIAHGVTDIIITPHYRPTKEYVQTTEQLKRGLNALIEEQKKQKLSVNLYLGREIDEVKDLKQLLQSDTVSSINDTKLILIDFGVNK